MILTDTGPIIAILDRRQGNSHERCVETYRQIGNPLITTWPCFTEAMYFLLALRGWSGQRALWQLWKRGFLLIHEADVVEHRRMKALMEQYKDTPMDLADASLVTAAESLGLRRIFTLDSDFYVYRIQGKDAFEVIPARIN